MMSIQSIRHLNRKLAQRAAQEDRHPYPVSSTDIKDWGDAVHDGLLPEIPFPNLGYYQPEGWTLVRVFFVDSTGMGMEDEPAYSIPELIDRLVPGRGYALVEEGPMQIHVGEFLPSGADDEEVSLSGRATFGPGMILHEARLAGLLDEDD